MSGVTLLARVQRMTGADDTDGRTELTPPEVDHTHLPDQTMYKVELDAASHFEQKQDEVCMCLDGRAKYTLEREDGSQQVVEVGPREFVYLPGGARHKTGAVGDDRHEGLVAMPADPVARLEMLEGASPYRIEDWPVALWVDHKRDEVVARDADAVSE
jgi:quercetin dioxygenase-like cupin family protein